jgi:AraC family transcriptional regulator, exoenzyme S synthesis regulatory protein ExsA
MFHEYKTITYQGKVVFHKIVTDALKRDVKPFHDNEACFMFVSEGDFSVRTPDQLVAFKNSDGLLAKCFNFFIETTSQQRKNEGRMNFLGVYLFPDQMEEILQIDLAKSSHKVDYNIKRVPLNDLLNAFRDSIHVLIDNPELADENMIQTKLREFVLLISKVQNQSPVDFLAALFKLNEIPFKNAIHNNLYSNMNVSEFAKLCNMSLSTFKRKFSEVFQESPKKYIENARLEKAAKTIMESDMRISDIAYDCGYETISTFNRSFKSKFGKSPRQYRLSQTA